MTLCNGHGILSGLMAWRVVLFLEPCTVIDMAFVSHDDMQGSFEGVFML